MSFGEIGEWVVNLFNELIQFLLDLPKYILDGILGAIATIIEKIPAPAFTVNYSITDYIPADISYFLIMSSFPPALAIIGGAVTFRFLRRVLTLGIW
tara:strand:- start:134 stop:424 length:291 start_codon:yes stop_codon:yes gene_type:complete